MKKVGSVVLAALLVVPAHVLPAFSEQSAHIVGTVFDVQGNPVVGAEIAAHDSAGKVLARAITTDKGEYALPGLVPGQYNLTANPVTTGFKRQTVVAAVGAEGLAVNWAVSTAAPAVAAATPGARPSTALFRAKEAAVIGVLGVLAVAGIVTGAIALDQRGPRGRRGPQGPQGDPASPSS